MNFHLNILQREINRSLLQAREFLHYFPYEQLYSPQNFRGTIIKQQYNSYTAHEQLTSTYNI